MVTKRIAPPLPDAIEFTWRHPLRGKMLFSLWVKKEDPDNVIAEWWMRGPTGAYRWAGRVSVPRDTVQIIYMFLSKYVLARQ